MKRRQTNNQKGFAILEAVAFLMCFVILTVYVIDFFSAIHSGILGNIASRTYLLETLQHRSNIAWFRQNQVPLGLAQGTQSRNLLPDHSRFSATISEDSPNANRIWTTGRKLTSVNDDNQVPPSANPSGGKASTILLKTGYGICIDALCPKGEGG